MSGVSLESVRGLLHALIPVVALFAGWRRARARRAQGLAALGLLVVLSAVVYLTWTGRQYATSVNGYDVYHYYISTKYREELGTDLLYACTIVADAERKKPRFDRPMAVRDLSTYEMGSREDALALGRRCHERFSEGRWRQFQHDIAYFQKIVPKKEWENIFVDRGANASPIWQLSGGGLARIVPVESLAWATHVDTALLVGAVLMVAWAFDAEIALLLLAFLFTSFSTRWPPLGGALLRYDWLAASLAALSLWRKERYAFGGAALAYAVGVRIFPLFLFAGVAARGLWRVMRTRSLPRAELRFGLGFLAAGALLCGLAVMDSGAQSFGAFKEKMAVHSASENVSVMRVGLPVAMTWRGELPTSQVDASHVLRQKRVMAAELDPWIKGGAVLAGLLVLLVAGRRGLSDERALLLGVALIPLGLQISYYYYVFLAFPAIIHASRLPARAPAAGLFVVTLLGAGGLFATASGVTRWTVLAPGSVLVCLYAVGLIVAAAMERHDD